MTQPANELREPNVDYVKPPLLGAWGGFEEAMVLQVEEMKTRMARGTGSGKAGHEESASWMRSRSTSPSSSAGLRS